MVSGNKLLLLVALAVVSAGSLAGGYVTGSGSADRPTAPTGVPEDLRDEFGKALNTIQDQYAGEADLERVGKHTIQGMLRQLDPHSSFFTKAEFDELQTEQKSRIYGIGVTITRRYDRVYIISAVPQGPAQRAGLRYGDAIVAVDGQNVEDASSEQVMHRVRGEKGSPVEITVDRAGAPTRVTVTLERDEVRLPSVRNAFMIGRTGIGFVALTGGFSSKTDEELTSALETLKREGMQQLVLDLRDNPGGLLEQAVAVALKFLPPGLKILEMRGRENDPFRVRTYEVPANNVPETMPMVILINRRTASASEVVAGALQDHDRALIVGENSFGKGLVQSVINLWGGAGLTLTTAKYYTPTGRLIQRDYSNVSFYDYYANRRGGERETSNSSRGDPLQTDIGREVFGGGGITPDEIVESPEANPVRGRLFLGVFDFVRQLVAGQIAGFRDYRVAESRYESEFSPAYMERFPVNRELTIAFRQYISGRSQFTLSEDQFNANLDYTVIQLRREIATAAFGPEAGEQVYLADDPQLRKAIESLDKARMLADNARRVRGDRQ